MHLKELIARHTLVVLDFKMTGTDCEKDRIIEIGAVRIQGWDQSECEIPHDVLLTQKFSTFVYCPERLSDEVKHSTGITDEALTYAPDIRTALRWLKEFVGDDVIVGYYMKFIDEPLSVWGEKVGVSFDNERLDILDIARSVYSDKIKNYSLEYLAKFHGIEYAPRRAVECACVMAKLLAQLALRDDDSHCNYHLLQPNDKKSKTKQRKQNKEDKIYDFKHSVYVALDFSTINSFNDNVNRVSVQLNTDEVIEVAAVKIVNGEIAGHFHSFAAIDGYDARNIEFGRYRSQAYFAEADHLIGAPSFKEVVSRLSDYVKDSILVLRCDPSFTYTDFSVFRDKARKSGFLFNNATIHIDELVTAALLTGAVERSGKKFESLSVVQIAQMLNRNSKRWEDVFQDYGVFFDPRSEDILKKDRCDPLSWALAMAQFFIALKKWEIAETGSVT